MLQSSTEFRNQYKGHSVEGQLPKGVRPSSNIRSEGQQDWETGRHEYRAFELSPSSLRPNKAAKGQDNLKPSSEKLEDVTEHRERYVPKKAENLAMKVRPTTNIQRGEGSMNFTSVTRRDIMPVEVKRPEKPPAPKATLRNEGQMELVSTNKTTYMPQPVEKPIKGAPSSGNLKVRSKSAEPPHFVTTSSDYKQGFTSTRPPKVRSGKSTLRANGGIGAGNSVYKEQYGTFASMTDLRVKPQWYSEMITPYGDFAEGQPRALGMMKTLQSVA